MSSLWPHSTPYGPYGLLCTPNSLLWATYGTLCTHRVTLWLHLVICSPLCTLMAYVGWTLDLYVSLCHGNFFDNVNFLLGDFFVFVFFLSLLNV